VTREEVCDLSYSTSSPHPETVTFAPGPSKTALVGVEKAKRKKRRKAKLGDLSGLSLSFVSVPRSRWKGRTLLREERDAHLRPYPGVASHRLRVCVRVSVYLPPDGPDGRASR